MSDDHVLILSPSPLLHINGRAGKPLMTFDMEKRTITVAEDVEIGEIARQVIDTMNSLLQGITPPEPSR